MEDRPRNIFADRLRFLKDVPRNPQVAPSPTPAEVGAIYTRRCIDRYWATRKYLAKMEGNTGNWSDLIVDAANQAEDELLMALLTWPVEGDGFSVNPRSLAKTSMRPRGVQFEGKLYLAVRDPDDDTPLGEEGDGAHVMRLAVVDMAHVTDFDATGGDL